MTSKEQEFYDALRNVFVGVEVEGESGYINLMHIKSRYFQEKVFPELRKDIEAVLDEYPDFRNELFDKLYDFFHRYFSESGSIYFRRTRYSQSVYGQVYTDDRDVMLFWKTRMLYYVKTEQLFQSLEVGLADHLFFFDVSILQHKQANEKRDLVYRFDQVRADGTIVFKVEYSTRGRKTKIDDILKVLRGEDIAIGEDVLQRAFRVFERQSEVDYFINKDAGKFLKEQFDLWMFQYLFEGDSIWLQRRIQQLQELKRIAFRVIEFIAQFEDELVRIWNKPKFVRNSHYVITLDRIAKRDVGMVENLLAHEGMKAQIAEWRELGMVGSVFEPSEVWAEDHVGEQLDDAYQYLPLDTRHVPDLEMEIVGLFDHLDEALNGWLIKSENYQALNTILPKFRGRAQVVYIDPPFNTGTDFQYVDRFQDATWLTIMAERVKFIPELLDHKGSFLLHLDHNADFYGRLVSEEFFDRRNFINEVVWYFPDNFQGNVKGFANNHQVVFWYASSKDDLLANRVMLKLDKPVKRDKRVWSKEEQKLVADRDENGNIIYETYTEKKADDVWTIGQSSVTKRASKEYIDFDTQKPEELLRRLLIATSDDGSLVVDFFLGSATTTAVAHKLGRKWLGIEMDESFSNFALPRMKEVLAGNSNREPCGISHEVNWQGGGFFKYYELEQYENVLRSAIYSEDAEPFDNPYQDPFRQYVFLRDLKMLQALEIDHEMNEVHMDLSNLYLEIDFAETLANLRGKWIARITSEFVEFEDGECIDLRNLDWQLIKPLIWW